LGNKSMASCRHVTRHLLKFILVFCCCSSALANSSGEPLRNQNKVIIGYSSSLFVGVDKKDVQSALDIWVVELAKVG
jgi:hypothetical protein